MGIMQAVRGTSQVLQVSASNVSAIGQGFIACGNPGPTNSPGTFVSNGSGNYSYLWTLVGTPATRGPYTCSNATALNPVWSGGAVCDGDDSPYESWKISVTDNSTGRLGSTTISVSRLWSSLS